MEKKIVNKWEALRKRIQTDADRAIERSKRRWVKWGDHMVKSISTNKP